MENPVLMLGGLCLAVLACAGGQQPRQTQSAQHPAHPPRTP